MSGAIPIYFIEGFDHLSLANLSLKNWLVNQGVNPNWSVQAGRFGGQCLRATTSNGGSSGLMQAVRNQPFRKGAIANGQGFSCGLAVRPLSLSWPSGSEFFLLRTSASGRVVGLRFDTATQTVTVLNAAGAAVLTSTALVPLNAWSHIEVVGTIGTSVTVTLYVNGVSQGSASGVNLGTTAADRVMLQTQGGTPNNTSYMDFDDMFVAGAASQLGDCRVETLEPSTDGATTQWTRNAGTTNAGRVGTALDAANHDGDTSYNSDATVGDIDLYACTQLSVNAATVYAIQTNMIVRKDDAGTRQVAPMVRQGGVNYPLTTSPGLGSTYADVYDIYDQDPTGADWTVANVNGDQFGIKVAA